MSYDSGLDNLQPTPKYQSLENYWKQRCEAAEKVMLCKDAPKNKASRDNNQFQLFRDAYGEWQKFASSPPPPSILPEGDGAIDLRKEFIYLLRWYTGYSQRQDLTEKSVDDYISFVRTPPQPPLTPDIEEFLKYVSEAREDFSVFISSLPFDNALRTKVDDILIAYDQMAERLKK